MGENLVARYLEPVAAAPELAGSIEAGERVVSISRRGIDKGVSQGRAECPFELVVEAAGGSRRDIARGHRRLRHVVDA